MGFLAGKSFALPSAFAIMCHPYQRPREWDCLIWVKTSFNQLILDLQKHELTSGVQALCCDVGKVTNMMLLWSDSFKWHMDSWSPYPLARGHMGNLPKLCNHDPYWSWLLTHKKHILVDTVQLARTVTNRQSHRSQKTRLVYLGTFPELWHAG